MRELIGCQGRPIRSHDSEPPRSGSALAVESPGTGPTFTYILVTYEPFLIPLYVARSQQELINNSHIPLPGPGAGSGLRSLVTLDSALTAHTTASATPTGVRSHKLTAIQGGRGAHQPESSRPQRNHEPKPDPRPMRAQFTRPLQREAPLGPGRLKVCLICHRTSRSMLRRAPPLPPSQACLLLSTHRPASE